jgi:hypothetical protein
MHKEVIDSVGNPHVVATACSQVHGMVRERRLLFLAAVSLLSVPVSSSQVADTISFPPGGGLYFYFFW